MYRYIAMCVSTISRDKFSGWVGYMFWPWNIMTHTGLQQHWTHTVYKEMLYYYSCKYKIPLYCAIHFLFSSLGDQISPREHWFHGIEHRTINDYLGLWKLSGFLLSDALMRKKVQLLYNGVEMVAFYFKPDNFRG